MKKLLLRFSIFLLTFSMNAQCGNLYIAGIIDGPLTGGIPRGIQFCATANISDLSIYGFGVANDGEGSDGQEYTFPAESIDAGDCFWVGSSTNGWVDYFGFEPCYSSVFVNFNGDDAVELFCSSSVEDLFGDINLSGTGTCWDYEDGWAKAADATQNTTFACGEWTFSGANALDPYTTNAEATVGGFGYPSPEQVLC